MGGKTGTANLGFRFTYSLFDGISTSFSAQDGPAAEDSTAFSSDLDIAYDS
ncbi:hypothetical protein AB0A69_04490 [Streptomyces sp. NPDC045431]|uniref:hypothetical protein n=1 Tax=Streptomyces sp. NPDC045431 TaxID=3155613 RepID=UPI0033D9BE06